MWLVSMIKDFVNLVFSYKKKYTVKIQAAKKRQKSTLENLTYSYKKNLIIIKKIIYQLLLHYFI